MKDNFLQTFKKNLFQITQENFEQKALELFYFQAEHNPTYRLFLQYLRKKPQEIHTIREIPFLPIELFKTQKIVTNPEKVQIVFESSATTNQIRSKHYITDLEHYKQVSRKIFLEKFGNLTDYHLLALLPSYLERNNASLVCMVQDFIEQTASEHSGFYLDNLEALHEKIQFLLRENSRKILLIGVTFALLTFAEKFPLSLPPEVILMETGGMKGRGAEMTRPEVHAILKKAFGLQHIYSEYGMTELLSQAYTQGEETFYSPIFLQFLLRETNDPLSLPKELKRGVINVIDLANCDSCAFIATQDLGEYQEQGIKILGRVDNTDIRGCNLLAIS